MKPRVIGSSAVLCLLLVFTASSAACVRPNPGDIIGRVIIPQIGVNISVVEGTNDDAAIPGPLPVHYRSTNLPGEGQAIVISAHHFTHPLPGAAGGPFLHLDRLKAGSVIYLTRKTRFGGGKYKYIVSSNRPVDCGHTRVGYYKCPRALDLLQKMQQTKVFLITCKKDGFQREVLTAFAVSKRQL